MRLSSPVLIAMQDSRPAASQPAPHLPLSNVGWIGVMLDENKARRECGDVRLPRRTGGPGRSAVGDICSGSQTWISFPRKMPKRPLRGSFLKNGPR